MKCQYCKEKFIDLSTIKDKEIKETFERSLFWCDKCIEKFKLDISELIKSENEYE